MRLLLISIWFLLILPILGMCQSSQFTFSVIATNKLVFNHSPNLSNEYRLVFDQTNDIDTFNLCNYEGEILKHIYQSSISEGVIDTVNIIRYNNEEIDLNKLIKKKLRSGIYLGRGLLFKQGVYRVNSEQGNFLILGAEDKMYLTCPYYQYWIVIKFENHKFNAVYAFADVSFGNPACFGDFNVCLREV
ncbi:hypothetical protein DXN04_34030 [Chitinophaga silvisoli]|uniref:Uncharacterized protein n=2 Tax=Chitinophaga silvisoli TaxID=2291814 RepID=A0A3E1NMQ7_9BACT|nr:hypothetical protein DXN04_34030 [Chitinophaga silvisoli]